MKRMLFHSLPAMCLALVLVATWGSGVVKAADGKAVFNSKCAVCHGPTGQGNGPGAAAFKTKPTDFCDPKFWQGDISSKISHAISVGKGEMVKMNLSPEEVKAVTDYISQTCRVK